MDPNAYVLVFCRAIQANGENNDVDIINLFCFTLRDAISKWGFFLMKAHLVCKFEELKVVFCKCYWKVQTMNKCVHGIMSDKSRWRWKRWNIIWTYIETSKLLPTSSRWQYANHFLLNKFTTILLDNHNGDEEVHLVWT